MRPSFPRSLTNATLSAATTPAEERTPTMTTTVAAPRRAEPVNPSTMHVKRITLTSKKNWWMVEMDQEEEDKAHASANSFSSSEETAVHHTYSHKDYDYDRTPLRPSFSTPPPSPPIYNPPRHPTSIFSFPTPTAYCAPPNPTANLAPCAHGSASELFKCVVKKPDVVQLEINGEMQSNASDVTVQFLAELRVYTTLPRHRNIAAFLGCLENVGMVLEYVDGRTLYDVVIARPLMSQTKKIDYHNQLLAGLTHLHSYGLSHGDLSLLNVQVTHSSDTVKLLDFGRSVSAHSTFMAPDAEEPVDPFAHLQRTPSQAQAAKATPALTVEQIHPGTRPFTAPEILRGSCADPLLADAYSFGMILVCLDRGESVDVKPWVQRKDMLPDDLWEGVEVFGARAKAYLKKVDERRRLVKEDAMDSEMAG